MNKYTEGPWEIYKEYEGRVSITKDRKQIADAWDIGGIKHEEMVANARLIAAAPELLEALEPFAKFACDLDEGEHCDCHNCRAKAVIAKAKGSPGINRE